MCNLRCRDADRDCLQTTYLDLSLQGGHEFTNIHPNLFPTVHGANWTRLAQVSTPASEVLQSCPHHLRGRFHQAARCALEVRHVAVSAGDPTTKNRAWTWFCLLLFMLFLKQIGQGRVGKRVATAVRRVQRGDVEAVG